MAESGNDKIPTRRRVLIVGAGMAGLSAAEYLNANGITDLLVLEASNRIGGRMHTRQFGALAHQVVEMGANFFEGTALTNSAVVLSNERCGIEIAEDKMIKRTNGYFYRSDGRAIDRDLSTRVWNLCNEWTADTGDAKSSMNLDDYFTARQDAAIQSGAFKKFEAPDIIAVVNYFRNYYRLQTGGGLRDMTVSSIQVGETEVPGGCMKISGMDRLVQSVSMNLRPGQIALDHEVTNIRTQGAELVIRCRNGFLAHADYVIVTCPLGYMKENMDTLFTPPLTAEKRRAMDCIGFGKVGKIFMQYARPFWTKGDGRISLAWADGDSTMRSDEEWYKTIEAFDEVLHNDNVLVAWVTYSGVDMMENLTDETVKETCTLLLRRFLNNPSIPRPERILKTGWANDKLYRGAYSYATDRTKASHYGAISAPVLVAGKPRILFAGEAMTESGCINGARDSGIKEAQRVLLATGFPVPKL